MGGAQNFRKSLGLKSLCIFFKSKYAQAGATFEKKAKSEGHLKNAPYAPTIINPGRGGVVASY